MSTAPCAANLCSETATSVPPAPTRNSSGRLKVLIVCRSRISPPRPPGTARQDSPPSPVRCSTGWLVPPATAPQSADPSRACSTSQRRTPPDSSSSSGSGTFSQVGLPA